jgi:hypothetical protein
MAIIRAVLNITIFLFIEDLSTHLLQFDIYDIQNIS